MWGYMYGVYAVISIVLMLLLNLKYRITALIKIVIVLCLPIVGWLLPMIWSKDRKDNKDRHFHDYIDKQQSEHQVKRMNVFNPIEKQRELGIVPLEDALVISNYTDRRKALIEVLKQDAVKYIEVLQRAVSNEDTETSHYAVSAIMEMKSKLLISMQDLEVRYEQNKYDADVARAYMEVLSVYLKSGFIDERTKRKYQYTYLMVINQYLERVEQSEQVITAKLDLQLELGLYQEAEETALQYIERFPLSENSYLSLVKYYFIIRSSQKLEKTIERLKMTPIKLSSEGLTTLRYWSKGVINET